MHNTVYGNQLLKYINDKNISNIQLTKKEYVTRESDKNIAIYGCGERMPDYNVIEYIRELFDNPFMPSPTDLMYAAYQKAGIDVDYDDIFPEGIFIEEQSFTYSYIFFLRFFFLSVFIF